jgi:hypothetical protein
MGGVRIMYKWVCNKCGKSVSWDGTGAKPDTGCSGGLIKKHPRIQMPLKEMPNK